MRRLRLPLCVCVCVSADVSARNQCRVSNKQKAMLNGAISLFFVSAFRSLLRVHTSEWLRKIALLDDRETIKGRQQACSNTVLEIGIHSNGFWVKSQNVQTKCWIFLRYNYAKRISQL
jgi:hypothetical protein